MRRGSKVLSILTVALATPLMVAQAQPPASFGGDLGDIQVGATPVSLAAGDLDGDGIPDLAVANADDDSVTVLLGNGDGTFSDIGVDLEVGVGPLAIALGDFNNDGRLDIITADDLGATVSVLLNLGGGFFAEFIESDTGGSPLAVVVGFFDEDEFLDAATADNFDDTVTILKGNGDGSFTLIDVVPVGVAPIGLGAADLDGDGRLDLVVVNGGGGDEGLGSVTILQGLEEGRFDPLEEIEFECGAEECGAVAVAIADFDGDGFLDLAIANEIADSVSILLGNGDLTFSSGAIASVGGFPLAIVAEDFNLDGIADIATSSNFEDKVVVLVGVGDGTFQPQGATNVAQDAPQGSTSLILVDASRFPATGTVEVGATLLRYTNRLGNTLILEEPLSQSISAQAGVEVIFPVGAAPAGIATADFNGDGKPDLATANEDDQTVSILLNTAGPISTCVGDCEDDGEVTIDDIIKMVNIALQVSPIADCLAGDANKDGEITIDEILIAVNNALTGCPVATAAG
jgi:hypothetical protein